MGWECFFKVDWGRLLDFFKVKKTSYYKACIRAYGFPFQSDKKQNIFLKKQEL